MKEHTITRLTLAEAQQAIAVILKAASDDGKRPVSAAVVDPYGELIAFARMDGSTIRSASIAVNKAYTAARMEQDTANFEEGRDIRRLGDPRFVTVAGGVAILRDGACVGGIGVSGRPSAEDYELAKKGAAALMR
ncbi:MAG: heme-binding protein [Deltaproteobacteria bacterium]|nr:heme-binding protein [Deltaproteobacteria bacterium]